MNNLTLDQRKWIVRSYCKHENAGEVRREWTQTFHTQPPTRLTIYRIRDKFNAEGSIVNKKKSGRPKTASSEDNEMQVALTFVNSPKKSTRRASLELSIPRTSLQRLMKKLLLRPYRPRLLHGLLEDDPGRRIQFCKTIRDLIVN